MTNNGDLLAEGTTASSNTLYRLVAATGRWQSLGVPPGDWTSPLIYSTGPESGVLWRVVTELAGNVTPVQTARDLPVVGIYTVDYPSP